MFKFIASKFFNLALEEGYNIIPSSRSFVNIWAYEPKKPACLLKREHKSSS